MNLSLLGTGVLGGLLGLDATALAQTLISQPLVGGMVAGALWGEPWLGLQIGALLQLFALAGLPLGGHTPDDYATAGVVAPTVAVHATRTAAIPGVEAAIFAGLGAGFLAAWGGRFVIRWVRARNEGLTRWAEERVRDGDADAIDRAHALALLHQFGIGAGFTWLMLAIAIPASNALLDGAGWAMTRAAHVALPVLWAIGCGLAVRQLVPLRAGPLLGFFGLLAFLMLVRQVTG